MATEVVIPIDLWEEDVEAVITNWMVSDGSVVVKDALIAEIMTEKIQHEIHAPSDGMLKQTKAVDDIIKKGDVIGTIS